jgi:glycogen operon protein
VGDSFLLLMNAGAEDVVFTLPPRRFGLRWALCLSTAEPDAEEGSRVYRARGAATLRSRSVLLLRRAA